MRTPAAVALAVVSLAVAGSIQGAEEDPTAPPDVAAAPPGAELTASGLACRVLAEGTGSERPEPADRVRVHYSGWTTDGVLFDSSHRRGEPSEFALDRVIAGWSEAVQLMVEGERRRCWVPEELAYRGEPGRPAGTLVFDIELLGFERRPAPPPAPADVAGPPADAERTRSGLATKLLVAGTGETHPRRTSTVTVHYSGWTTDGALFDSSVTRGEPATFRLDEVIPGWTEGLRLMVEGEKRRLWIPEKLAYRGREGFPAGMLVFDVELLRIDRR